MNPGPTARPQLLVVDDDPATCLAIKAGLAARFEVTTDLGGEDFAALVRRLRPQVILLDVNLPGLNGLRLLESIRPLLAEILVFMITVRGGDEDIVTAFQLGARDYVTKPFSLAVLEARILRWLDQPGAGDRLVRLGATTLDLAAGTVVTAAGTVRLTRKEILVLQCLIAQAGMVVTREKLLAYAWGYDYEGTPRTVDNVVAALRRKLGFGEGEDAPLSSRRGLGYCLDRAVLEPAGRADGP